MCVSLIFRASPGLVAHLDTVLMTHEAVVLPMAMQTSMVIAAAAGCD